MSCRKVIQCALLGVASLMLANLAAAQEASTPTVNAIVGLSSETAPPNYCNPCLFYGGDFDPNYSRANATRNENTLSDPNTTLFIAFSVPHTQHWAVTGLFVNTLATDGGVFDPPDGTWSISTAMSAGNPGTTLSSGVARATITPTGRTVFGSPEYTVSVSIPRILLGVGEYWFSVVPQCTNSQDSACSSAIFQVSNTDGLNSYGGFEAPYQSIFNSTFFSDYYRPLCQVGAMGCKWNSAGVIGTSR